MVACICGTPSSCIEVESGQEVCESKPLCGVASGTVELQQACMGQMGGIKSARHV